MRGHHDLDDRALTAGERGLPSMPPLRIVALEDYPLLVT